MNIEIRDDRFLDIVPEDLELETLANGFAFTEGPIWHPHEKHLTFSDIPNNRMHRWSERRGVKVFRKSSNMANGNTYDLEGRILSCEHATSRVTRTEGKNSLKVLASHYEGKELNSPNDIVVRRDGTIWFTDPTFGRLGGTGLVRKMNSIIVASTADPDSFELKQPNGRIHARPQRALRCRYAAPAHPAFRHRRRRRLVWRRSVRRVDRGCRCAGWTEDRQRRPCVLCRARFHVYHPDDPTFTWGHGFLATPYGLGWLFDSIRGRSSALYVADTPHACTCAPGRFADHFTVRGATA